MAQGTGGEFRYPHSVAAVMQQLRLTLGDQATRAVGDTVALLDDRDRWVEDNFALLAGGGGAVGASGRVPAGAMLDFAGPIAPEGWLLCDGAAYVRTEHQALFDAIGVAWGAGDGATTFNVPDLRGRVPVGAGAGASLTPRTTGQYGGTETHVLTTAQMPAHTHLDGNPQAQTQSLYNSSGQTVSTPTWPPSSATTSTGSGAAHPIMQPFAVVTKIIRG